MMNAEVRIENEDRFNSLFSLLTSQFPILPWSPP